MGVMKIQNCELNNLWQCWTTQTSFIGIFSTLGKLTFTKFLPIRINQVNLKVIFCLVPKSKMAFYTEFYQMIFHFEIQKKHRKHSKIQKIFRICMSNTIEELLMAKLKIFLQYEASIVLCAYRQLSCLWYGNLSK